MFARILIPGVQVIKAVHKLSDPGQTFCGHSVLFYGTLFLPNHDQNKLEYFDEDFD
jgi:hypothetical protein